MITSHKIKFLSKKEVAQSTVSYYFYKPIGFQFQAGQYFDFFLPDVPKSKTETGIRSLSLSSAPFEKEIGVTIRLRNSGFKTRLNSLVPGDTVIVNGPLGDLIVKKENRPLILIAGGIGITPFRSLVLQAIHNRSQRKIFLFYFNQNSERAAFLNELQKVENLNFKLIPAMTRDPNWKGENSHINKKILLKYLKSLKTLKSSLFFLAGSPEMVRAVKAELLKLKVPEESIIQEEFDGY